MSVEAREHRFTVDDFHRMAETGILSPDDRLELIDGVIVEMTPIDPPHASAVDDFAELLFDRLGGRARIRVQNPIVLHDRSQPVPDLTAARRREGLYQAAHPRPEDIHFLIEVADSSTHRDRREKLPRYAAAGVREVWLVDLPRKRIEIHRDPSADGYVNVATVSSGTVFPSAFPDVAVPVDEILG